MMDKFFLKSKTIIGIVVSILPALAIQFGLSFSVDDAAMINTTVDQLIQAAGALIAVWGRFDAGGITVKPA
jgi:hypothetical protein